MTYDEAVTLGATYVHNRGFAYRLKDADLQKRRIWKLKFEVQRGHARGDVKLEYDGYSRALLTADEKVKSKRHKHHGDDDDDEDDDDERRKRRKWDDD